MSQASHLSIGDSDHIAYQRVEGGTPGVVFLCGHGSDMEGTKAVHLEAWAQARVSRENKAFCRADTGRRSAKATRVAAAS